MSNSNEINYNYGSLSDAVNQMKNSNQNIMSSVQDLHQQVQQNVQSFKGHSSGNYETSFKAICNHLNSLTDRLNDIHTRVNSGADALNEHDRQYSNLFH